MVTERVLGRSSRQAFSSRSGIVVGILRYEPVSRYSARAAARLADVVIGGWRMSEECERPSGSSADHSLRTNREAGETETMRRS
jgi:hypothetical protein